MIGLPDRRMPVDANTLLPQLSAYYIDTGQKAITDFDEMRTHVNEIVKILETVDAQLDYPLDKAGFCRS